MMRKAKRGRRLLSAALCAVLALSLAGGAFAETDVGLFIEDDALTGGDAVTQTVSQAVSLTAPLRRSATYPRATGTRRA